MIILDYAVGDSNMISSINSVTQLSLKKLRGSQNL